MRSKVLAEMKNKCSSSSNNGRLESKTSSAASKNHKATSIADRLQACLENDKIKDLELIGRDGVRVPALRCILGSASPVLERMLYGDFAEAKQSSIEMGDDCSSKALQALVEYCCSDRLNIHLWEDDDLVPATAPAQNQEKTANASISNAKITDWNEMMQDLVAVAKLGHTYAIPGLQERVQDYVIPIVQEDPSLACAILNAAHPLPTPELYTAAMEIIQSQPYVALKQNEESKSGGIVCLSPDKLEEVLQDRDIEAEELFLFQCFVDWKEYNEYAYDNIQNICDHVIRHFQFACIDPKDLKSIVMPTGLVSQQILMEAFMEQAIVASEGGFTFAAFRGPRGPEGQERGHALVQGAGNKGCNGIYTEQKRDVNNHSLLYYFKPDKKRGVTYYLIKDRTESWKICENTTALYEWKPYDQSSNHEHNEFPQRGWARATSSGGLPSAKVKLPVPTCKFFRPRNDMTSRRGKSPSKQSRPRRKLKPRESI